MKKNKLNISQNKEILNYIITQCIITIVKYLKHKIIILAYFSIFIINIKNNN